MMSSSKCTFKYLAILLVLMHSSVNANYVFKVNLIKEFTPIYGKNSLPQTGVCSLGLLARRERCKAAVTSEALGEYKCKVVFGTVSKASVFEFHYSSPVNGNTKMKKWAIKCSTKPIIYLVDGEQQDNYDVMIANDSETSPKP